MLKFLQFLGYLAVMVAGLFVITSAALGSWRNGARYTWLWSKHILALAVIGGLLGWVFLQFIPPSP
jgi:hypothetical protein